MSSLLGELDGAPIQCDVFKSRKRKSVPDHLSDFSSSTTSRVQIYRKSSYIDPSSGGPAEGGLVPSSDGYNSKKRMMAVLHQLQNNWLIWMSMVALTSTPRFMMT